MLRNLSKEFAVAVGAGESAIRIDTDEIQDCILTLVQVGKKHGWEMRVFDVQAGTVWVLGRGQDDGPRKGKKVGGGGGGPADILNAVGGGAQASTVIQTLTEFWLEPSVPDPANHGEVKPIIYVIKNLHLGFEKAREGMVALVQHLVADKVGDNENYQEYHNSIYKDRGIAHDSDTGKFVVGLMPAEARIPPEVGPLFKHLVHELPDEAELARILKGVVPVAPDPDEEEDEEGAEAAALSKEVAKRVCKFALGLTRQQAEGVFAASLVQFGKIDPQYVWEQKSMILNKEGLVELYQGKEKFSDVAGLAGAKDFMKRLLTPDEYDDADKDVRAKGALFCGAPGVGKSLIAKATGNELGIPTLMVHPGNWFGGIVGESEAKTRKGFQILRAHAPCIAVIDEIEKVMPSSRGHQGDGGVGARMEGTFLTQMNDMVEPVFWVFTANDVKRMHEAFFRAERVDGVFYVRLPGPEQRAALWKLYGKKFFPKEVVIGKQTHPFPGHIPTDLGAVLEELKKATPKKSSPLNVEHFADRFVLPLMCIPEDKRDAAVGKIADVNEDVGAMIKEKGAVTDTNWSPAEIRACCRLARRLKEPLRKTQMRIRPVSVSAERVIRGLEEWASESALDAESGEVYVGEATVETRKSGRATAGEGDKVRRKVRSLKGE